MQNSNHSLYIWSYIIECIRRKIHGNVICFCNDSNKERESRPFCNPVFAKIYGLIRSIKNQKMLVIACFPS